MTKVLILAAGEGTRLRPLTNNKPKCLVPLVGRTLLDRQIDSLKIQGVKDIHIATGYCAEQLEVLGYDTSYNEHFQRTNMVESLFSAIEFIQACEEDLIISYGDIVYNPSNLEALLASEAEIALMVDKNWHELWSIRMDDPLNDAETLVLDKEGCVLELGQKPESYDQIQGQYTGLIKIRKDKIGDFVNDYLKLDRQALYDGKDFYNMYMTSFLQILINKGWKIKAVEVDSGWLEIDSTDDLNAYEALYKRNQLDPFYKA
ncbi:phosphocholine cytidylyltransferase family protein [Vibrio sp. PNB22_8_1]|uniref:phosphocholine cytidylyltransferase family protein n=1 Tax=unclassified Vibrio TaxID=2614977 RepID=UPI00406A5E00